MNNPVNMEDPSGNWPKWIGAALEAVAGAFMVLAGVSSVLSGAGIIVGIALIAYGLNHAFSGGMDIYNSSTGNDEKVGKNNLIKNQMEKAYGEDTGEIIYEVCDLAVAITTFKLQTPTNIAKMSSVTLENYALKITSNNIKSYTGINGVKDIFSTGYNINWSTIASTGNKVKDYANRIIKIFDGRE